MVGPMLSLNTASKWLPHLSDLLAPRAAHPLPQAASPDDSLGEKGGRGGEPQPVRCRIFFMVFTSYNQCLGERLICFPFTDEDTEAQRGDLAGGQVGGPGLNPKHLTHSSDICTPCCACQSVEKTLLLTPCIFLFFSISIF